MRPAPDQIADDVARALFAHNRQDGTGDIHRADEARRQLSLDLLWGQLLKVAPIEVGGIVDQYVDAPEPIDSGPRCCLSVAEAGDVQLDDQQVIRRTDGLGHSVGVRPVATTAWPAARAALVMSTPMPRPAPVINQTFLSVISFFPLFKSCFLLPSHFTISGPRRSGKLLIHGYRIPLISKTTQGRYKYIPSPLFHRVSSPLSHEMQNCRLHCHRHPKNT